MKLISHITLGRHSADITGLGLFNRLALIIGSVEPDLAAFTYLRGSGKGEYFKGHTWKNIRFIVERLCHSLGKSERQGLLFHFRLGKLLHYTIDSFTYPHNTELFKGSLKEHMDWEDLVHAELKRILSSPFALYKTNGSELSGKLTELHEQYAKSRMKPSNDVFYGLTALYTVLAMLVNRQSLIPERIALMAYTSRSN